ncbi:hypothetical protein M5D96_008987 [Drosophila gunungcola]|uniref:Uncharacterized protein n=1 Tax=Drosophila gunungcola TaxID=103775 RepID=A0A9Q0BMU8_9MUSC|nr:hypothetical protein M5D96_008987 [Drosophila gunungcola]
MCLMVTVQGYEKILRKNSTQTPGITIELYSECIISKMH